MNKTENYKRLCAYARSNGLKIQYLLDIAITEFLKNKE